MKNHYPEFPSARPLKFAQRYFSSAEPQFADRAASPMHGDRPFMGIATTKNDKNSV